MNCKNRPSRSRAIASRGTQSFHRVSWEVLGVAEEATLHRCWCLWSRTVDVLEGSIEVVQLQLTSVSRFPGEFKKIHASVCVLEEPSVLDSCRGAETLRSVIYELEESSRSLTKAQGAQQDVATFSSNWVLMLVA